MGRMKTKIQAIVITGMLLLTAGCEWLELLPPNGLVFDEYWSSSEDVEATLLGAYQQFAKMDEKLFLFGEIRADMIEADQAPAYQKNIINTNIFSSNQLCNWADFYKIINYCNNVIVMAPEMYANGVDPTFTEIQRDNFVSEAVFLRSLAYFYLVRVFKDVPYITQPTMDDDVDFYVYKSSGDSILSVVAEDLLSARLTIPSDYTSLQKSRGRATKGAVNALLADISLWSFEYEKTLSYIEDLENLNLYFLMTGATWFEIYNPGNSLEGIFELYFDGNGQDNTMYNYTYSWNYYRSSPQAVSLLDPEVSMERVRGPGSISIENTNYRIWKYCGNAPDRRTVRASSNARACNFIIYRLADVMLMKAEALSQLNRFQEAQEVINEIRYWRLMEPVSPAYTREAFEDAILEERAKELAFEGKRWFDLMRMGRRDNFSRKNELIEVIIEDAPSTQKLVLSARLSNPLGWYLPIYENELERNANLVQNPYYDNEL